MKDGHHLESHNRYINKRSNYDNKFCIVTSSATKKNKNYTPDLFVFQKSVQLVEVDIWNYISVIKQQIGYKWYKKLRYRRGNARHNNLMPIEILSTAAQVYKNRIWKGEYG